MLILGGDKHIEEAVADANRTFGGELDVELQGSGVSDIPRFHGAFPWWLRVTAPAIAADQRARLGGEILSLAASRVARFPETGRSATPQVTTSGSECSIQLGANADTSSAITNAHVASSRSVVPSRAGSRTRGYDFRFRKRSEVQTALTALCTSPSQSWYERFSCGHGRRCCVSPVRAEAANHARWRNQANAITAPVSTSCTDACKARPP